MKILEKIFSVKNIDRHKVFCFLGIKLKFYRRNYFAEECYEKIVAANKVISGCNKILKDYKNDFNNLNKKLENLDKKLDNLNKKLNGVNDKLTYINQTTVSTFQYFTGIELNNNFIKERQIVFNPQNTPPDHYKRYEFAANLTESDDMVLDCACACGYGTSMIAKNAKKAVGVDINQNVINFAQKVFGNDKTEFVCQDAQNLNLNQMFNKVVSFETLEHILKPELFLQNVYNLMTDDGLLICSVPNEDTMPYENSSNHFHFRHYTEKQFIELVESQGFKVKNLYHQYWDNEYNISEKLDGKVRDLALIIVAKRKNGKDA